MLPCGADEVTVRATSGRRASVADSLATSDDERERRHSYVQRSTRHRYKAPRQRGLSPHLRVKITEAEEQCFAGGTEGTSPWRFTPESSPSLPASSTSRLTPLMRAAVTSNETHVPDEAIIPLALPHDAPLIAVEPSPPVQSASEVTFRKRQWADAHATADATSEAVDGAQQPSGVPADSSAAVFLQPSPQGIRRRQWADSTDTDTGGKPVATREEETQATGVPTDNNAGAGNKEAANVGSEPGKAGKRAVSKPRLVFSESSEAPSDDSSQQELPKPRGDDGLNILRSAFRKRVSVRTHPVCFEAPRLDLISHYQLLNSRDFPHRWSSRRSRCPADAQAARSRAILLHNNDGQETMGIPSWRTRAS